GHWQTFDYWWVLAIAGLGGLLGVLFSVPLRRTLIIAPSPGISSSTWASWAPCRASPGTTRSPSPTPRR
ncbi:MAG TPA: hypothetical protein VLT84_05160, partial [Acidobacteriota bacterium]|nr:hypothetical protein [Acidobacteriota bacterium]